MTGNGIAMHKDIAGLTRETLTYLLDKHYGEYRIILEEVRLSYHETTEYCPNCRHKCSKTTYYQYHKSGHVIAYYMSCDCGFTSIYNIGGWSFSQEPGKEPCIWRYGNPDVKNSLPTEDTPKEIITGAEAIRIIETMLVRM